MRAPCLDVFFSPSISTRQNVIENHSKNFFLRYHFPSYSERAYAGPDIKHDWPFYVTRRLQSQCSAGLCRTLNHFFFIATHSVPISLLPVQCQTACTAYQILVICVEIVWRVLVVFKQRISNSISFIWYQVSRESHKQMKDPAYNGYAQIRRQITPLNPIRVQHRRSPAVALAQFNDPIARNADEERAKTNIKSP